MKISTIVVVDRDGWKIIMGLISISFIVFSITLIITKSKILGGKREFVETRYESAQVNNQKPGLIHTFWHSMWTCSMCCGFWVALIICYIFPVYNLFADTLIVFGANWLLHCLESTLFFSGEVLEKFDKNLKED